MSIILRGVVFALGVGIGWAKPYIPGEPVDLGFKDFASEFLDYHCLECHDEATKKGDLSLEDLGTVDETNAALWKSIWAQVSLREMPPKKKEQPEVIERLKFLDWIVGELQRVMKDKGGFQAHLDPHKGNFLDHDLLFGKLPNGIELAPPASPKRIWRVTPQEHITRLNELINTEPEYDPKRPGMRTRGDTVPTNHGGELKLYFGADRIIKWQGGTVAYATSVKSVPVVLSSARKHGFENYPNFHTVNSAEATQILGKAEDILRYMAYGPLSIANPEQITDDPATYEKVRPKGDLRGLPTALVYSTKVKRPLTPVYELLEASKLTEDLLIEAVTYVFEAVTFRPPVEKELEQYLLITSEAIEKVGKEDGVFIGLSAIFLDRDALFRPELGVNGKPSKDGRVMLQDWELGLAVNHALSYIKPDEQLRRSIVEGRMRTRADVRREVTRMLMDDSFRKPRVLRFFRDYFDHDLGGYICKDDKALAATGVSGSGSSHYRAMFDATASTDRLIELILEEDKEVLRELLTTQKVVATQNDSKYFGRLKTRKERDAAIAEQKKADKLAKKKAAAELVGLKEELEVLDAKIKAAQDGPTKKSLDREKKKLEGAKKRAQTTVKRGAGTRGNPALKEAKISGPKIFVRVSHRSFGNGSMKPERTLATAPEGERMGILTHPSWLVSHSDAMDNHAILRGRWIRERLLGGGIPDVPITVDAMLPDQPNTTLRSRMRVTRETYCWTCHRKMDPLGLPFEMFNHAGLYRTTELGEPVDTSGVILDSGDPKLDGPVENALDLIKKLSESERVEQVFIRHAFRYWMGRNETLNDAPVLREAHRVYRESGGSMQALISSLVTSDAFLYRR